MLYHSFAWLGIVILALTTGLNSQPLPLSQDPEQNFEYAWKRLDRNYAQFEVKHIDWQALHRTYRPQVSAETTSQELWDILQSMLQHLNDAHVCLEDGTRRVCGGLTEGIKADDFSLALVKNKYLQGNASYALNGKYTYGRLAQRIGYLHIKDFKDGIDATVQGIDTILGHFTDADFLVIDVRCNTGGTGRVAELVAERFADRKRHFMCDQIRYGVKHDDLLPVEYRHLGPNGSIRFTRPILLLTNRLTESAAERFLLAMRVLPQVTVVGDLSGGALSSQFPDRLPNGWTLWVAFKVVRDHNGVCWDGIGIPPDLRLLNTPADVAAGRDRVLEFALRLLENGPPAPQPETESLLNLRTSLVEEYLISLKEKSVGDAIAELNRARTAGETRRFLNPNEVMQQTGYFLGHRQFREALGLLHACRQDFPQMVSIYTMLAQAYLGVGEITQAEEVLKQGESFEAMLPWEPLQFERVKVAIRKQKLGSAAKILDQALATGGIPEAKKTIQELERRRDQGPVFDEPDFNTLGYRLLQENKIESAVFIFDQTVRLFPNSWNAYDSLGEALGKAGLKQRAIESYRRSLELNPGNKSGLASLNKLEKEE